LSELAAGVSWSPCDPMGSPGGNSVAELTRFPVAAPNEDKGCGEPVRDGGAETNGEPWHCHHHLRRRRSSLRPSEIAPDYSSGETRAWSVGDTRPYEITRKGSERCVRRRLGLGKADWEILIVVGTVFPR